MPVNKRTLVIGTTPDYIIALNNRYPDRCLFVVDKGYRTNEDLRQINKASILFCNFELADLVARPLAEHNRKWNIRPVGITCYDCEWLVLTAWLADLLGLEYPSVEAVTLSRDKYQSKLSLNRAAIRCPQVKITRNADEAIAFAEILGKEVVLKPLSGSGSELVFVCRNKDEIAVAFETIRAGLNQRVDSPMYRKGLNSRSDDSWRRPIAIEEYVDGDEYSCDAILHHEKTTLVRTTRKYSLTSSVFGTTSTYVCPAELPVDGGHEKLRQVVNGAGRALGLQNCICMVDFKISNGEIVLLEITPRVGGDCLPQLVEHCSGLDTLGISLDLAEGGNITIPPMNTWSRLVAVRFFARRRGTVVSINTDMIQADSRVREVSLKFSVGHKVHLPPQDYASWMLGHAIFRPNDFDNVDEEAMQIADKLNIKMEPFHADRTDSHGQTAVDLNEAVDA